MLVQPAVTHVCTQVPGAGKGNISHPGTCIQAWVTAGWTTVMHSIYKILNYYILHETKVFSTLSTYWQMYKQSNCHLVTVSISICQQHSQHQYILSLAIAYCSKGHEKQGNSTIIQFIKFQQYKNVSYLSFTTGVMCDTLDANDGTFPETPK